MGGLRADVNVSVKPLDPAHAALQLARLNASADGANGLSYGGVHNLGQRTEIKNLSSIAAVAAAIAAERDRQILLLESGGRVEGETRGWTLGATCTHRLRGKEGEVDYRYMPDADLAPLVIGADLVEYLRATLPELPEETVSKLVREYGVSEKDARTLVEVDEGERLEFYFEVMELLGAKLRGAATSASGSGSHLGADLTTKTETETETGKEKAILGRQTANFILHELGALLSTSTSVRTSTFNPEIITAPQLASILALLQTEQITLPTAKALLARAFDGGDGDDDGGGSEGGLPSDVDAYVDSQGLRLTPMTEDAYTGLAEEVVRSNTKMAAQALAEITRARQAGKVGSSDASDANSGHEEPAEGKKKKKTPGKLMWFVGQMVRRGEVGRVQPERAERAVREVLLGMEGD